MGAASVPAAAPVQAASLTEVVVPENAPVPPAPSGVVSEALEVDVPEIEVPAAPAIPPPAAAPAAPAAPAPATSATPTPTQPNPAAEIKSRQPAARAKVQARTRARLDKIIELAQKKRSIKNNDVEMLLKVSDPTATRYLSQLVREGRLKRVGKPSVATFELP